MNELEDEPQDVQDAKPVEDEIKVGEQDELLDETRLDEDDSGEGEEEEDEGEDEGGDGDKVHDSHRGSKKSCRPFKCHRPKPAIKKDVCCAKKKRKKPGVVTMYVHDKPCTYKKKDIIPRKCLTPEEYLNFLATPKERCQRCSKVPQLRKFTVVSPRINEMALPTKRRIMNNLQQFGRDMPAKNIDNLMGLLEETNAMSPEQAEQHLKDQRECRRKKKENKLKKTKERQTCCEQPKCCPDDEDSEFDKKAVMCQYKLALKFVKAILKAKQPSEKCDEYRQDIARVILRRQAIDLGYHPIGNLDVKSEQMRLVADLFAGWITGVLVEVAEEKRKELLEECEQKRAELEELAALEELESLEDEYHEIEDFEKSTLGTTNEFIQDEEVDEEEEDESVANEETQYELDEMELEDEPDVFDAAVETDTLITQEEKVGDDDDTESIVAVEDEEGKDIEMQTDVNELVETATEPMMSKSEPEIVAEKLCQTWSTDIPFINFVKIFETIFCMIDHVSETTLECPMDNRIHRAIYEQFEAAAYKSAPNIVTQKVKDMMDVIAGKLAKFIRKTLQDNELEFLMGQRGQVESKEVRDWTKRITEMTSVADDWSNWLDMIVCEACKLTSKRVVTRGDWAEWTSKFETNAMLFRRMYLEAVHDEHHDIMMIADREVTKTGTKKKFCLDDEIVLNKTSFDSCKKLMMMHEPSKISSVHGSKVGSLHSKAGSKISNEPSKVSGLEEPPSLPDVFEKK